MGTPQDSSNEEDPQSEDTMPMVSGEESSGKGVPKSGENRYEILKTIGKGGFGEVFLAQDKVLDRQVALKVISRGAIQGPNESLLIEGRTLAQFEHPAIVSVYDVGEKDGELFFVSQLVEGDALGVYMRNNEISPVEAAKMIAKIAEALAYAHARSVVHRDIKPTNIIVTPDGNPVVIDFGIALSVRLRESRGGRGAIMGTPAYMSPEQARGEGHLVDGRSDLYSLGVILYELLTGRRPFEGSPSDLLDDVASLTLEVTPPRQVNTSIPRALERICLRALAKRTADRYATAGDFAEDLFEYIVRTEDQVSGESGFSTTVKVVPKGLRAFDENDADFFLQLLPGLRDQKGIPDSIRFWQRGVTNQLDPFRVGVVYGPSGSGKSSFLKAGLIPMLPSEIEVVEVAAEADRLESLLLDRLQQRFSCDRDLKLSEVIREIREEKLAGQHGKLLIVIDQFEQWLHTNGRASDSELVAALRQCDGKTVQVLITLRDDFWMGISQLMEDIDVPLEQSRNVAAIDLFDRQHARSVLSDFGEAYQPIESGESSENEERAKFIEAALSDMEQDGKFVPLQLALFAEMAKHVEWTLESYEKLGGATAIGVEFLESSFSSRAANPAHRAVEKEARSILKALLPAGKSTIRGESLSREILMERSEIAEMNRFLATIKILDSDLKLITPVDSPDDNESEEQRYQLTHDFLVEALRLWLSRKENESRRGRALIRLRERTDLWVASRERKQLPTLGEWIAISLYTTQKGRKEAEHEMMASATRYHLTRFGLISLAVAMVSLAAVAGMHRLDERQTEQRVDDLVEDMSQAEFKFLPGLIDEMEPLRSRWESRVEEIARSDGTSREEKVRASLALARGSGEKLDFLIESMLDSDAESQTVIREELLPWSHEVVEVIGKRARSSSLDRKSLIRAAAVLAHYSPEGEFWEEIAPSVVSALMKEDPLLANSWVDALLPARKHLLIPAYDACYRVGPTATEHILATSVVARFGGDDPELLTTISLAELLMDSDSDSRTILFPSAQGRGEEMQSILTVEWQLDIPMSQGPEVEKKLLRQANAVETLYRMGNSDPFWASLDRVVDPRLATILIERFPLLVPDIRQALQILDGPGKGKPRIRQAVLIGLSGYEIQTSSDREMLRELLLKIYRTDPDPGLHSAAEWMLRRVLKVETPNWDDSSSLPESSGWRPGPEELTMIRIEKPGLFWIGSPENEVGRDNKEKQREFRIDYSFELSSTEVTVKQFQAYLPEFPFSEDVTRSDDCPQSRVSCYDAMKYCRWLSENDPRIDIDKCCYPEIGEIKPGMTLAKGFHLRPGYRLPLSEEWEYACRAGTITSRFFGDQISHIGRYAWYGENSQERLWPVASLRPNQLGFFDILGNVDEWTHGKPYEVIDDEISRGGSYRGTPRFIRAAMPRLNDGEARASVFGFRVIRTIE